MENQTPLGRALFLACLITVIGAAIACLPSLTIPVGLYSEGDALDYHLPIIKWIVRHHSYPNWSWTYVDDYPMFGEILMIPFFLVKTQFARIVAILAYFGAAGFAALVGGELLPNEERKRELTLFFFAGLLGFQPLLAQACQVMVDNVANCFALASLYFLLRRRTLLSGAALALALASRYMIWGAAPGMFFAMLVLRRRPKEILQFTLLASLGALPTLLRNLVLNGNPVYPLLDGFFHGTPFTDLDGWGRGTGLKALLLFPYDLFYTNTFVSEIFESKTYPAGFFTYRLGFLTYIQIAAAAAFCWKRQFHFRREHAAIAALWLALFLFWFYGVQFMRYFGFGLALIDLAILYVAGTRAPKGVLAALALLPLLSIGAVQGESWRIAFGNEASFFASGYVQSAMRCFERAGVRPSAVMGYSSRDALNGFFDYDFVFYPPNPLYRALPGSELPRPDFIYSGLDFHPVTGYQAWPADKPCLLRRIEAAH
ncbi:MAG: hypothetical protein ACXVCG_05110 [Bdellovibrionota bacterium]